MMDSNSYYTPIPSLPLFCTIGTGKAVMAAMILHPFSECTGIEYLEGLHSVAMELQNTFMDRIKPKLERETSESVCLCLCLSIAFTLNSPICLHSLYFLSSHNLRLVPSLPSYHIRVSAVTRRLLGSESQRLD